MQCPYAVCFGKTFDERRTSLFDQTYPHLCGELQKYIWVRFSIDPVYIPLMHRFMDHEGSRQEA